MGETKLASITCLMNRSTLDVFLLLLAVAFVSSQADHTSATNTLRTSTNSDSSNVIQQDSRDKRLENKINDCLSSNSSTNDNVTNNCNNTQSSPDGDNVFFGTPKWFGSIKSGALERTGLVALGIMLIIVVIFVIRAIRLRQKRSKSRKYGVIASTASDVEMEPLERGTLEDDEEETTLFDAQHNFRIK